MTKSIESSEKNNTPLKQPKFSLENPPSIETSGFIIEYDFLRPIKVKKIPNLDQYLEKLNHYDWTCLLAHNPRQEFLYYLDTLLDKEIIANISWRYVIETIKSSDK